MGAKKLLNEFPSKGWSRSELDNLLRRIDARGSTERKVGSGRPRSARTSVNISKVEDLICSQDDAPSTHKSPREIEQITGSSVQCILKKDLALKSYKRTVGQRQLQSSVCNAVKSFFCVFSVSATYREFGSQTKKHLL